MENSSGPFPRIFVSHSNTENDFGIKLALDLRHIIGDDRAVWYDIVGCSQADDPWWHKITEALTACKFFILVLSPDALKSEGVLRELAMALAERKHIILLLCKRCETPSELKALSPISFLPPDPYEGAFHELLAVLGLSKARKLDLPTPLHEREALRPGTSIRVAILGLLTMLVALVLVGGFGLLVYIPISSSITGFIAAYNAGVAATAQVNATATATVNVIADNPDPYPSTNGTLALYDPLDQPSNWQNSSHQFSSGGTCQFVDGAYHAQETQSNTVSFCVDLNNQFNNFAFEVQMKISKGDCGGMSFRHNPKQGSIYAYLVCEDGAYFLELSTPTGRKNLTGHYASAFVKGLNQSNLIAIVANGATISLYINHQKVDTVIDNTLNSGYLGFIAGNLGNPTEVIYTYAKVWQLSAPTSSATPSPTGNSVTPTASPNHSPRSSNNLYLCTF